MGIWSPALPASDETVASSVSTSEYYD